MPRSRGAETQRNDNHRRRGEHAPRTPIAEHPERRGAVHAAATETTDSFQLFLNQQSRYPLLTREEEVELAQRIEQGYLAAQQPLITPTLRLVIKSPRRYQGHGLTMQDL